MTQESAELAEHSVRATGITENLRDGRDLEVAARIAGHESTRTTHLYNRLREEISLDEIERIHIGTFSLGLAFVPHSRAACSAR